jgi:hypothetical protein
VFTTPIELDKPRNLRFGIQDCIDMENMLGLSLGEVVHRLGTVSITVMRGALWAGLKHEEPDLTLQAAGDLLEAHLEGGGKMSVVSTALSKAIANSTPLRSGQVKNERPKAVKAS